MLRLRMIDFIGSIVNPKYRIMKGIQIGNRSIFFIGAYPIPPRDTKTEIEIHGYIDKNAQSMKISFNNQPLTYWKSGIYRRIYTFKQLLRWRRLLPHTGSVVLEKRFHKWDRI